METRQLAYFIAACQTENHAAAARLLGIAPSTLSTSLALLEEELGMPLFGRTRQGFYPMREARWLAVKAETILRGISAAQCYFTQSTRQPLRRVEIRSSVRFVLGQISKALSGAIAAAQAAHPEVFFDVRFTPDDETVTGTASVPEPFTVRYLTPDDMPARCESLMLNDEWVVVSNTRLGELDESAALAPEDLDRFGVTLPLLPDVLLKTVHAYCDRHNVALLLQSGHDVGALSRLSQQGRHFALMLPASTLSKRLGQRQLNVYGLQAPLFSRLVAGADSEDPALARLAGEFRSRIAAPEEDRVFAPLLTLRQVHYFNTICESGTITRAAERLRVAQPALSSQIHKLEKTLSCRLFDRKRSGLMPTEEGQTLRQITSAIAAGSAEIRRGIAADAELRVTRLRIGVIPLTHCHGPVVTALSKAVMRFRKEHPDVKVTILEGPTDLLNNWLADGQVHFALVETPPDHGTRLVLGGGEPLGLVTARGSGFNRKGPVPAETLAGLSLVLPTTVFGLRRLIDEATAGHARIEPEMEVNSLALALAIVARGGHGTILPRSALPLSDGRTEFDFTPICEPEVRRALYVSCSNERELTGAERSFITSLRENMN